MKISDLFGLKRSQHELDFVDVDIDSDTPLFLDPYFIAKNDFPFAYDARLSLRSFFACLLNALKKNRIDEAKELFSHLGESNEVCLGFSKAKPQGKGMGPSDSRYQAVADEGENGFTAAMGETFLTSVYTPSFTP